MFSFQKLDFIIQLRWDAMDWQTMCLPSQTYTIFMQDQESEVLANTGFSLVKA